MLLMWTPPNAVQALATVIFEAPHPALTWDSYRAKLAGRIDRMAEAATPEDRKMLRMGSQVEDLDLLQAALEDNLGWTLLQESEAMSLALAGAANLPWPADPKTMSANLKVIVPIQKMDLGDFLTRLYRQ